MSALPPKADTTYDSVVGSDGARRRHVTGALLQSNSHPGRTKNQRHTNLDSSQFENDAVRILVPRHLYAAARPPRRHARLGPFYTITERNRLILNPAAPL